MYIKLKLVIGCALSCLFVGSVTGELHEFKLPDGRALKAEIISYNARLEKVELKRADGKHVNVKPDIFVDEDQKYIKEWASLEDFRNESCFKVECKKRIQEKWRDDNDIQQRGYTRVAYELLLENKSSQALKDLRIEYRIFYDKEAK